MEIALARGNVYRLLSQVYLHPSEEFFNALKGGAFADELRSSIKTLLEANDGDLKQKAELMQKELSRAARGSLSKLRSEYYRVFGHTISMECPPYETQYGVAHLFQQTQELSDVSGFYRAFGLETKSGERLDHISVELEFMHFLCCKQAYATQNNHGRDKIEICVEAQEKFLGQHLGKWVFVFTKLLKRKEKGGFYRSFAELTESFIAFELAHLDVKPQELSAPELTPSPSMDEESCPSCISDGKERVRHFKSDWWD